MMRRILVTGGAGFIGSHVAARLLREGNEVVVVDDLSTGKKENVPDGADLIVADLGIEKGVEALDGIECDAVIHMAGQSSGEASFKHPYLDMRSHVVSTFSLLSWCMRKEIMRFIYGSSMAVYGEPICLPIREDHPTEPLSFYGASKLSAETYIRLYQRLGMNTTIFRLFSIYGPGQNMENKQQGMVSIYLSYMLEKKTILVKGPLDRFRDFVYIDDVVDAVTVALANDKASGEIFNIATGEKTTVRNLLGFLTEAWGAPTYPTEVTDGTKGDQFGVVGDASKMHRVLGWKPKVGISEGIAKMVKIEKERRQLV